MKKFKMAADFKTNMSPFFEIVKYFYVIFAKMGNDNFMICEKNQEFEKN
jgi:hypothetical protein